MFGAPVVRVGHWQALFLAIWVAGAVLIMLGACLYTSANKHGFGRWWLPLGVVGGLIWIVAIHLIVVFVVMLIALAVMLFVS